MQVKKIKEVEKLVKLNISKLVADLGGASATAKIAGVPRTAPYGWIDRQYVSSTVLEIIKTQNPDIDLDKYFEEDTDEINDKVRVGT
jgi:menaquinone-dependent protoporphyrinogen IX oxidase